MVNFKKVFVGLILAAVAELFVILFLYASFEGVSNKKEMFDRYFKSKDYETAQFIYYDSRNSSDFKVYADAEIKDRTSSVLKSLNENNSNDAEKLNGFLKNIKMNDLYQEVNQKITTIQKQ